MAMIPAIMTGTIHLMSRSGRRTPIALIPTPDLEVPYDAPRPIEEAIKDKSIHLLPR